jgi:hypothetical protein
VGFGIFLCKAVVEWSELCSDRPQLSEVNSLKF